MHMNYRFVGIGSMETFAHHDIIKTPDIDYDFARFEAPLNKHF